MSSFHLRLRFFIILIVIPKFNLNKINNNYQHQNLIAVIIFHLIIIVGKARVYYFLKLTTQIHNFYFQDHFYIISLIINLINFLLLITNFILSKFQALYYLNNVSKIFVMNKISHQIL